MLRSACVLVAVGCALGACDRAGPGGGSGGPASGSVGGSEATPDVVIAAAEGVSRPPFVFGPADEAMLEEISRAAFGYFWSDVHPETGMVRDRSSAEVVSVAGVGFQLSALVVGAERGWVSREDAEGRARLILSSLANAPENRRWGLFFHYLDGETGGPSREGYETVVSTIDSALLFAGMATASSYFGGEVAALADAMLEAADWRAFLVVGPSGEADDVYISLGWKASDGADPGGDGELLPFAWVDAGAEHRLVTFLAVGAQEGRDLDPRQYYRLRRTLGMVEGVGPVVWFPWSGALFTSFFSHCWIDYAHMGADDPASLGVERRASVDWWENSRRLALMHRNAAIENPEGFATVGPDSWGVGASDGPTGYHVAHLFPEPMEMPGSIVEVDFPPQRPDDNWMDGTIAPYAAGSCIMFTPAESVAALRHYRSLRGDDGEPLVWRGPEAGGFGFLDAFNLDAGWVAPDYVAIDQGPLLLGIENARSGLLWRVFHGHPVAARAVSRLGMRTEAE
ncbi:MAG: glucoamylase family protein [Phycisphaerales bacterium JB054]